MLLLLVQSTPMVKPMIIAKVEDVNDEEEDDNWSGLERLRHEGGQVWTRTGMERTRTSMEENGYC